MKTYKVRREIQSFLMSLCRLLALLGLILIPYINYAHLLIDNYLLRVICFFLIIFFIWAINEIITVNTFVRPWDKIRNSLLQLSQNIYQPVKLSKYSVVGDIISDYNQVLMNLEDHTKQLSLYTQILDKSSIVIKYDMDGVITYVNKTFEEVMGYSYDEIVGQTYHMLHHESTKKIDDAISYTIKGDTHWFGIIVNKKKSGHACYTKTYVMPIHKNSEIVGFISVKHDITDLIHIQEELKSSNEKLIGLDEKKNQFINIASHELRTPMTAIKGYISLLLDGDFGPLSQEQNEVVAGIYENTQRLINLINDMLDISKIESGKESFTYSHFPINRFLHETLKDFQKAAADKNISLISDFQTSSTEIVFLPPDKLQQVVINLVANALKFTPAGGTVTFGSKKTEAEVILFCKDTGVGIDPKDHQLIFEKFGQAYNPLVKNTTGSGLGLAIIKTIIEKLGGSIELDSNIGKGTTFVIHIPV